MEYNTDVRKGTRNICAYLYVLFWSKLQDIMKEQDRESGWSLLSFI